MAPDYDKIKATMTAMAARSATGHLLEGRVVVCERGREMRGAGCTGSGRLGRISQFTHPIPSSIAVSP
jgi:hypothetical protein